MLALRPFVADDIMPGYRSVTLKNWEKPEQPARLFAQESDL